MDKFFKTLIYVIIKTFSKTIMGIGYIVLGYPIWTILFCGFKCLDASYGLFSIIFGYIILIAGSMLNEHNEENNKPKS